MSKKPKKIMGNDSSLLDAQAAFKRADFQEARAILEGIITARPKDVEALVLNGRTMMQLGDTETAAAMFTRALEVEPGNPGCLNALGAILFSHGLIQESEDKLRQAVERAPNFIEAKGNLGLTVQHLGKHEEAVRYLQEAVQRGGATAKTMEVLGTELIYMTQPDRARTVLSKLVDAQPDNAMALSYLGMALGDCGKHEEAETLWKRAQAIDGTIAEPDACRARMLRSIGDIDGAVLAMERALMLDQSHAATLFYWAYVADGNANAELSRQQVLQMVEAALAAKAIPHDDRCQLDFAAGKLLENAKEHTRAAEHYVRANQQVWLRHTVERDMYQNWHDHYLSLFDADFFDAHEEIMAREQTREDRCGEGLIFIVGMPRSGTTLVEQIVSRNERVTAGGERPDIDMISNTVIGRLDEDRSKGKTGSLPLAFVRDLASRHHAHVTKLAGRDGLFTDKSPRNFMNLGMIACLFPRAKVLHTVRNPIDTCVSCYFNYFAYNCVKFSYDQEALGQFFTLYRKTMNVWRSILPVPVLDVVYEDLVGNPDANIRVLTEFCSFDWSDRFLHPEEARRAVNTASMAQVNKPIYTASVGRWAAYESHLEPLLKALGDEPERYGK